FVRALFDARGWVEPRRAQVGFTSASPRVIEEVRHLLRRLGIWARVHGGMRQASERGDCPRWRLYIAGTSLWAFAERVGFSDAAKAATLTWCVPRSRSPQRALTRVARAPAPGAHRRLIEAVDRSRAGIGIGPQSLHSLRRGGVRASARLRPFAVTASARRVA